MISKFVGPANCTLKIHLYWTMLQYASVLRLCKQEKYASKQVSNFVRNFL